MQMKKLRCDKPYDIDEARKEEGAPAPQAQGLAHHGLRAQHRHRERQALHELPSSRRLGARS